MNVQQLIELLNSIEDKTKPVVFERINEFGMTVDYPIYELQLIEKAVVLK